MVLKRTWTSEQKAEIFSVLLWDEQVWFLRKADSLNVGTLACTVYVHKKVKFTLEQASKAQRGRRGIALLYL